MKKYLSMAIFAFLLIINSRAYAEEFKVAWKNPIILLYENVGRPAFSPDGKWLAFLIFKNSDARDIWKIRSDGNAAICLIGEDDEDYEYPIWIEDGNALLHLINGNYEMKLLTANGKKLGRVGEKKYEKDDPKLMPDGKKVIMNVRGIDPPGVYMMAISDGSLSLVFPSTGLPFVSFPFAVSPDAQTLVILNSQELIFINMSDGVIKGRKKLKNRIEAKSDIFWVASGKYLVIGNLLYLLDTGEEMPFLPLDVLTYKEEGKPDLVATGPETFSKDGRKVAFTMYEKDTGAKRSKIKILDLEWK